VLEEAEEEAAEMGQGSDRGSRWEVVDWVG
jgi:hypothetical protein